MPSLSPLEDDEVLLWQGAPDPRAHLMRWDFFLIPLSILWLGVSVANLVGLIRSGGPVVAVVVMTIFALIGAYLVFGRFIVKAAIKRVTVYRLTNRRALIDKPRDSNSMSINPDLITMRRNPWTGHVDLVFGAHLGAAAPSGLRSNEGYANSGLDFFTSFTGGPFAFYDVRDRDGLELALARAGVALVDRGDEQG